MDRHASPPRAGHSAAGAAPIAEIEAAEFAEYLRTEHERRRAAQVATEAAVATSAGGEDAPRWSGGMYRRAMMRAYAESIGVDREMALSQYSTPVDPRPAPSPRPAADVARPAPARAPAVPPRPSAPLGEPARQAAPRPRPSYPAAQARPARVTPPRYRPTVNLRQAIVPLVGLVVIAAAIWGLTGPSEDAGSSAGTASVQGVTPAPPPPASGAVAPQRAAAAAAPAAAAPSKPAAPRPPATEGTLSITSVPAGARVTVNGIGWGETPVTIRHLEFGQKQIRLTMQGYVSEERSAYLSPTQPASGARVVLRRRRQ